MLPGAGCSVCGKNRVRILSGIVIAQLKQKGARMIVTSHATAIDPRSAIHPYASPDRAIGQAAASSVPWRKS